MRQFAVLVYLTGLGKKLMWAWAKFLFCQHFAHILSIFSAQCWRGCGQNADTWWGWAKCWCGRGQMVDKTLMWSKGWCGPGQNFDKTLMWAKCWCGQNIIADKMLMWTECWCGQNVDVDKMSDKILMCSLKTWKNTIRLWQICLWWRQSWKKSVWRRREGVGNRNNRCLANPAEKFSVTSCFSLRQWLQTFSQFINKHAASTRKNNAILAELTSYAL